MIVEGAGSVPEVTTHDVKARMSNHNMYIPVMTLELPVPFLTELPH